MFVSYADVIRDIVGSMIEIDTTNNNREETEKDKDKKKVIVEEKKLKPTALPQIRAPRKRPSFKNKWNTDSKKELMREYMRNYRSEGKDVETGNRYVKKLK